MEYSRSTCELIDLHSAYLGASGSIWMDQCGCSELLCCSVVTSKPLYIFLILLDINRTFMEGKDVC